MNKTLVYLFLLVAALFTMTSCEKAIIDTPEPLSPNKEEGMVNLTFSIAQFEQIPFSATEYPSRATAVDNACTRIGLALFRDGTKVKNINQDPKSDHFGQIALSVSEGSYTLVVVAHSGDGSATITSPTEIKFSNNKLTDTFYRCEQLDVKADAHFDLELKRAVAKIELHCTDNMPANVAQMKFYYTGGSSTLDATTGYGCKQSRQTELRTVGAEMVGKPATFSIYTFPHSEEDALKLTVTALDANGNILQKKAFENVPVKRNTITRHSEAFFGGSASPSGDATFGITVDEQWAETTFSF